MCVCVRARLCVCVWMRERLVRAAPAAHVCDALVFNLCTLYDLSCDNKVRESGTSVRACARVWRCRGERAILATTRGVYGCVRGACTDVLSSLHHSRSHTSCRTLDDLSRATTNKTSARKKRVLQGVAERYLLDDIDPASFRIG